MKTEDQDLIEQQVKEIEKLRGHIETLHSEYGHRIQIREDERMRLEAEAARWKGEAFDLWEMGSTQAHPPEDFEEVGTRLGFLVAKLEPVVLSEGGDV